MFSFRFYWRLFNRYELNQVFDATQKCFDETFIGRCLVLGCGNQLFAECFGEYLDECFLQNAHIFCCHLPASVDWWCNRCWKWFFFIILNHLKHKESMRFYNLQSYVLFSILLNCNGFTEMARNIKKSKWAHSKYKQFSVKKIQYFSSSCLFSSFSDKVSYCCWSVGCRKKQEIVSIQNINVCSCDCVTSLVDI